VHLFEIGFWNLLQHCLETDQFLFLHDALGYESLLANSNSAQAILNLLSDFADLEYKTLAGGMDSLPRMLAFRCGAGDTKCVIAELHTLTQLTFKQNGCDQYFELEVLCTPLGASVDAAGRDNSKLSFPRTFTARNVILALPKAALSRIRFVNFPAHKLSEFEANREHVTAHPAFKLFLRYKKPWWTQEFDVLEARATTDLPLRQVYYMASGDDDPAMIMASYSDEHYVEFWAPLLKDPRRIDMIAKLKAPAMQRRIDFSTYAASERIMRKAEHQLRRMHGEGLTFPEAEIGVVQEWKEAWHFWNVYTKPWEVAAWMVQPFGGTVKLFTCGEAYSLEQGWVEGALKSAERVLMAIGMGVKEPEWIERRAYGEVRCDDFKQYVTR
jgi:flavin-dependent amine oxidoreductase